MKIYMFHYVTKDFNYFHFDADEFENVIKELVKYNRVIGLKELYDGAKKQESLEHCIMLTFDDGTRDHYKYVYPILKKYNIPGVFFIGSNVINGKILDIHIIHQLFAKAGEERLYDDLCKEVNKRMITVNNTEFVNTKFDGYKMKYVKQLLQFILPENERKEIIDTLSKKYGVSKKSTDYYMTFEELKEMKDNNMEFGLHTESHNRLNRLDSKKQEQEIMDNYKLLKEKGILSSPVSIAYPFGAYNADTLKILKDNCIVIGFSINGNEKSMQLLELKRHDANELKR